MEIIIKPQTDRYIDQIWGAISKFLQVSKDKHPLLPKMEVILEDSNRYGNRQCAHEFVVEDITDDIIMIRCNLCHRVFHVQYEKTFITGVM